MRKLLNGLMNLWYLFWYLFMNLVSLGILLFFVYGCYHHSVEAERWESALYREDEWLRPWHIYGIFIPVGVVALIGAVYALIRHVIPRYVRYWWTH